MASRVDGSMDIGSSTSSSADSASAGTSCTINLFSAASTAGSWCYKSTEHIRVAFKQIHHFHVHKQTDEDRNQVFVWSTPSGCAFFFSGWILQAIDFFYKT
jgi:hypothetical protein